MNDDIAVMLAQRMPGTLKRLSDSLCLLPSRRCYGCHGCKYDLLHVETDHFGNPEVEPAATCLTLDFISRFKVDDFSSDLVARRAARDSIVENRGSRFAAHVFMSVVEVRCNANSTNFCQLLSSEVIF